MSGNFAPSRKSKTEDEDKNFWSTRWETFHDGEKLYGGKFQFDVAAEPLTAKCDNFYCLARGEDALVLPWPAHWWCNPPFDIKFDFIDRALYHQRVIRHPGMMLLPYEPASGWWRRLMSKGLIIYEPDGRIGFYERDGRTKKDGVNFPSALIAFPTHHIGESIRVPYTRTPIEKEENFIDGYFKRLRAEHRRADQRRAAAEKRAAKRRSERG